MKTRRQCENRLLALKIRFDQRLNDHMSQHTRYRLWQQFLSQAEVRWLTALLKEMESYDVAKDW